MLKNYFVTAYRHLLRHPLYSAINILGFAVGLACCIVIIAYVRGELSYEQFLPENDRVYRVVGTWHDDETYGLPVIMGPAGRAMAEEIPGIESYVRFSRDSDSVKRGDMLFYESVTYGDPSFFDVIPLPFVAGDAKNGIRGPNTVVLSEAMAKKYFGDENPVGQVMVFDADKPMTVTGVFRDLPENTHLKLDFISNYHSASYSRRSANGGDGIEDLEQDWGSSNHFTYIRLAPGVDAASISAQLPAFEDRHFPDVDLARGRVKGGDFADLSLQRFTDIHLHSADLDPGAELKPPGDIMLVYAFAGIAALILLIASLNFVVLTTARSPERAKEIGMRKVLGSSRRALITQFLMETLLVALTAFVIALSLSELVLPWVRDLLEAPLAEGDPAFVAGELFVIAAVGLIAGAYPALYMSALRPAEALKGKLKMARGAVRTALVVIQFTISIALTIVASVMFAQTDYMRNVRSGYTTDDVIVLRGFWRDAAKGSLEAVRARLESEPSIAAIAAQHAAPGDQNFESRTFQRPAEGMPRQSLSTTAVDFGFFELYQVKLIAGRLFSRDYSSDLTVDPPEKRETSANAVITLATVKALGFDSPEAAIGQPLNRIFQDNASSDTGQVIHYTIIGVVDDIQLHDARYAKTPTVFFVKPDELWSLSIKARPGQVAQATAAAEAAWRAMLPDLPARVTHLDTQFANTFARDARKGAVFAAFAGLGLSIACLGLFGLAAFTVERRTKEIGIRKVMGASTGRIVRLLVWQFSQPVLIANLIAWPLAWYISRQWLEGFADRIDLTPLYFIAASLIVLAISWATVSGHALRVARAKPVRALRYE